LEMNRNSRSLVVHIRFLRCAAPGGFFRKINITLFSPSGRRTLQARSRFSSSNLIEYLRELESICKPVLAHESGDPGVQFNEKTEGPKSRQTVPLRWSVMILSGLNNLLSKRRQRQ
jgi:hypothetical protein